MGPSNLNKPAFDTKAAVGAAEKDKTYYQKLTWQERMMVANYLNSIKYNYPENDPPRMDKTAFRMGRMDDLDKLEE